MQNKYLFPRNEKYLWAILAVYSLLLFIVIGRHEPWYDEAQAWLLARDSGLIDLFCTYLRYEGTPGLWHFILLLPTKLNLPYISLNIISGIIAITGVYVFLRYSPFSPVIKILFPFSYFIFYQYAVVARSYVLFPVLLFMLAVIYKEKTKKIYAFTLLCSLLALVSLHGTIIASSLIFIHAIEVLRSPSSLTKEVRNRQLVSFASFVILLVLILCEVWIPNDLIIGGLPGSKFISRTFLGIKGNLILLNEGFITNIFFGHRDSYSLMYTVLLTISCLIIYLSIKWFWQKNTFLVFFVPLLGLFFLYQKYCSPWHAGIIFLVWVFVLWISYESKKPEKTLKKYRESSRIITGIFIITLTVQIYWTICSIHNDYYYKYTPSKEIAQYIKVNHLENKKIFVRGHRTLEILPYFANNIFTNHNNGKAPAFMIYSQKHYLRGDLAFLKQKNPDIIIVSLNKRINTASFFKFETYHVARYYEGNMFWKDGVYLKNYFLLFEKNPLNKKFMSSEEAFNFVELCQSYSR